MDRTVLEWARLPFGEGEEQITRSVADGVHAVASRSPFGDDVLQLRHDGLWAKQVVGVVVTPDCTLEILPKIDFGNDGEDATGRIREQLVHMLAIALDLDISDGAAARFGTQRENLLEVLIGLFARQLVDAVRQGMPRRYVGMNEDIPMLRGRLDVQRQFTTLAAGPRRLACRFDELCFDIALNQIMKAAVWRLLRLSRLPSNQRVLRELSAIYSDISTVQIRHLRWKDVVLDRTSRRWQSLLDFARLLLEDQFQTTSIGPMSGYSLLFPMNKLFESYVARMLARTLAKTGLHVVAQGGLLSCLRDASGAARFQTRPDILIKLGLKNVWVVDAKWKKLAAQVDHPKLGVSQADVYQMMAYGRLYGCADMMLLYPHHARLGAASPSNNRFTIAPSFEDSLSVASIDVQSHSEALRCLEGLFDRLIGPRLGALQR